MTSQWIRVKFCLQSALESQEVVIPPAGNGAGSTKKQSWACGFCSLMCSVLDSWGCGGPRWTKSRKWGTFCEKRDVSTASRVSGKWRWPQSSPTFVASSAPAWWVTQQRAPGGGPVCTLTSILSLGFTKCTRGVWGRAGDRETAREQPCRSTDGEQGEPPETQRASHQAVNGGRL